MNIRTFRELQKDNIRRKELALFKEFLLFNNYFKQFNAVVGGWGYFYNRALYYKVIGICFILLESSKFHSEREWLKGILKEWIFVQEAPYNRALRKLRAK